MVRLSRSPREVSPLSPCAVSMERIVGYKMVELRAELRRRGFPTNGKKAELVARLASAAKENSASATQAVQNRAVKCAAEEPEAYILARSPLAARNGGLTNAPRRQTAAVPVFAPEPAATPRVDASHRTPSRHEQDECARDAGPDTTADLCDRARQNDTAERLQAMEQAMEEAISDMEKLDAQLVASECRVKHLQNELVKEKEESALVWGASQALRERTAKCEAELRVEREARQQAELVLQKCQQSALAAALRSRRTNCAVSCAAAMFALLVVGLHAWLHNFVINAS